MKKRGIIVYFGVSWILFTMILGAVNAEESSPMEKTQGENCAVRVVKRYIEETKIWLPDDYHIEFNRTENGVLVYWVIHKDDKATKVTGGKSVEVHVASGTLEVIRELHFQ